MKAATIHSLVLGALIATALFLYIPYHFEDGTIEQASDPLKDLCSNTIWQKNVTFRCDARMGLFNQRNIMLGCVRYAIEAGAALQMPRIGLRGEESQMSNFDQYFKSTPLLPMSELFDATHFRRQVLQSCPQLRLQDAQGDIDLEFNPVRDANVIEKPLPEVIDITTIRPRLATAIAAKGITGHAVVGLAIDILCSWDIHHDSIDLWRRIGSLILMRPDAIKYAADVLKQLPSFVGGHLRTERDAKEMQPHHPFEAQMMAFITAAKNSAVSDLYLASGDENELALARVFAREYGIEVHSKNELLRHKPDWNFDRMAEIDYLVLLKSKYFVGMALSTFSSNLVVSRHDVQKEDHWQEQKDGLSELMDYGYRYLRTAEWPYPVDSIVHRPEDLKRAV